MKRLVVSCDGTWSARGIGRRTNVLRLHDLVAVPGTGPVEQRKHYVPGVGTRWGERLLGGLTGYGLSQNVMAAYAWLVDGFEPGDAIQLLGFSRGAYTARSVAGLVRMAGVLRPEHRDRVREAYDLYRDDTHPDDPAAVAWRARYAVETDVELVGVWDTVGALGIPVVVPGLGHWVRRRYSFHDVQLSRRVRNGVHVVAVDERRRAFRPTLWQSERDAPGQRIEQVWFAGAHEDVGGHDPSGLSELTLWWMASRAVALGLELTADLDPRDPAWSRVVPGPSPSGVFRLLPRLVRRIGVVDRAEESVAESAVELRDAGLGYDPPNLRAYLAGGGRVLEL
ncbi:DUF2235 domain-containing protein [Nocardioides marmoraquaticus]